MAYNIYKNRLNEATNSYEIKSKEKENVKIKLKIKESIVHK